MSITETGLNKYFPPPETIHPKDQIVSLWRQNLHQLIDDLGQLHGFQGEIVDGYHQGIASWHENEDHGAQHSYDVWQGMRYLADQLSPSEARPSDQMLQAAAVLHDLFQFFTVVNPRTGAPLSDNPRKAHAVAMAAAIRMYGQYAGLSSTEINDLKRAIWWHDDSYEGKLHDNMPHIGKLLSDADKLYGAGLCENPSDLVRAMIERNRRGSRKANGWYLFRDDITPEQRRTWQYGDRWNLDALSATLHDVYAQSFYTSTAIQTYRAAQLVFPQAAEDVYGREYDETAKVIQRLQSNPNAQITLVGQYYHPNDVIPRSLEDMIDEARETELDLPPKFRKTGHTPRGVMLQIIDENGTTIIDPTVAVYVFRYFGRVRFIRQLQQVVQEYRNLSLNT